MQDCEGGSFRTSLELIAWGNTRSGMLWVCMRSKLGMDRTVRDKTYKSDGELLERELAVPVRVAVFVEIRQTPFGKS